jgi:hypothetical protein
MKPGSILALLLILPAAAAQDGGPDVEPTAGRAIRAVVRDLVAELPWRVENADALSIEAEPGSDPTLVASFSAALLGAGFRVEHAAPRGGARSSVVPIRLAARDAEGLGLVRATAGDFVSECAFGRASWVDAPERKGTIVVSGPGRATSDAALEAARKKLEDRMRAAYPALSGHESFERYLDRQTVTSFVARRDTGGKPVYEAYLLAQSGAERLARAERAAFASKARRPWFKAGALAAAGIVLWFLYARADFRTRGWRTVRLRLAFGTLFVALCLGLWSLPL